MVYNEYNHAIRLINWLLYKSFEINLLCKPKMHLFKQKYSKNINIVTYIFII